MNCLFKTSLLFFQYFGVSLIGLSYFQNSFKESIQNNIYGAPKYLKTGGTGTNDKNRPIKGPKNPALLLSILPSQLDKEQLKQQLMCASKCIELQIQKLDQINDRFIQKERSIFTKIVDAYNHHEHCCGWELAETRRMCRLLINARLALDQTLLCIQTVSNFDNAVTILGPCIAVIRSVSAGLADALPEVGCELNSVRDFLSGLMLETGFNTRGKILEFDEINQEATKILTEAATATTQKVEEIFLHLPYGN
jgi:division protein CdvB (Snf7/Vps24/ESCRT-III family)